MDLPTDVRKLTKLFERLGARDPEDLPSVQEAEKLFGAAGVDPVGKEVIIYTRKGDPFAYYGVHAMKYYGAKQAKVYHGGIDDWKAAGRPVTKEVPRLPPVAVQLAAQDSMVLWNKDMLERVRTGGAQILDVRTPREYAGDDIRAVRGGPVPGAVNIPHEQNWQDPQTAAKLMSKEVQTRDGMALKDEAELRAVRQARPRQGDDRVLPERGARLADRHDPTRARVSRRQGLRAVVAGLCGDAHRAVRKRGVRERRRAE